MMEHDELRTDVDAFLEIVKKNRKISLIDAAKQMNVPVQTVQLWTDFLVEEGIVGIEYKFTTPYVFILEEKQGKAGFGYIGFDTKEVFYEKAKKKGINENQIRMLWLKYITANEETMKKVFEDKARERGIPANKVPMLWKKYYSYLKKDVEEVQNGH